MIPLIGLAGLAITLGWAACRAWVYAGRVEREWAAAEATDRGDTP